MRNIKNYVVAAFALFLLDGCDFLDYDETSGKTKEEAYSYFNNMNSSVAYIYGFLPTDFGRVNDAMMESATDNSVYTWLYNSIYYITNGIWSPLKRVDDGWSFWNGIRSANLFLENFDPKVLERFQYNEDYDEMIDKASKFSLEVRFLRAFYLFELAKRYGDIPLITRTYTQEEINSVRKTSFADVIDFIAKECTEITREGGLPEDGVRGETGRVTKGAALALKSRALLYAASDLHNPGRDLTKWEAAAKAAYEVIGMNKYQLPKVSADPLYSDLGGNEVLKSKQLIFERRAIATTNDFESRNEPMGYEGAEGGNTPTQNLVDAYEMKDGTPFDWNNPTHVANMYYDTANKETRDPRLYKNVLTNGSIWQKQKVETFEGGKNKTLDGSTKTGYYLRKYMNPSVSLDPNKPNKLYHHYVLFRYAEILLNYAEAMNEWKGPDATAEGCPLTAREALNQVRDCADMKHVTENGADFTAKVRNERRIELAFEGHRFYDIRRWKIAGLDEVRNIYGVKIKKNGTSLSYEKVLLQQMHWEDKMYLFPYPQNEIYMNADLGQNPGWSNGN
ncbi:RagB/SusD family nutrient uptake outer membrane protein [Bacteroides sp. RTP21281st1_E4_RTP21281_210402]|uniref:RagB/SusD family nutrient uptake outer membrane protein n=1 Tax=unclassified Bacteroides TaxID=2646097 RepID=UPI0034A1B0DE